MKDQLKATRAALERAHDDSLDDKHIECRDTLRIQIAALAQLEAMAGEPVAWQRRMRPTWGNSKAPWGPWGPWEECSEGQAKDYWRTPMLHDWAYEARALYTAAPVAQQPQYDQTALELCAVCGWKTLIPGDCCLNCERNKAQQPQAEPDDEILKERDDAEDFIDMLLDEVLGTDRPEWTSAYGRDDALRDVQERMTALYGPVVDRAWAQFEKAMQPQAGQVEGVAPSFDRVPAHAPWCASLNMMLTSNPPKPAPCNCKQPQAEAVLGMYEHKCPSVTGHRGPSFVCQKAGHAVGQNSYCNECPAAPQQAEAVPFDVTDAMALAFHRALTDGSISQSEVEEIKVGLRAALAHQQAEAVPQDVGQLEYRGNSVAYIHQKMTAYRSAINAAWEAMRDAGHPPDGRTPLAQAITKALAPQQAEAVPSDVTDAMVVAGARALCNRFADTGGVSREDQWNIYAEDFKDDARAVLNAAVAAQGAKT